MSTDVQPIKPYLIRAYYQWICDSKCTPYLLVQANLPHVMVPKQYIDTSDNSIVFNISPVAINQLVMNKYKVQFEASFDGSIQTIVIPNYAILGLYAQENDEGVMFDIDTNEADVEAVEFAKVEKITAPKVVSLHPHLRVIKKED